MSSLHRTIATALVAALPLVSGCLAHHRGPMPGEPKNATYVEVEGARVRYVDTADTDPAVADKPVVVLVHGFASALETWGTVMPALAGEFRVIALDLKGFGWTDRPEGDYSPAAQAKLVAALMDKRGVAKAAIVAHSWGSSVALALALAEPAKVTRIALYDAWVYDAQLPTFFHWARTAGLGEVLFSAFYKERPGDKIARAFYDPDVVSERLVEEVEAALDRPGTEAAALAAVRGQRYEDVEGRYKTIQQETLLLWGREDQVTFVTFGERLVNDLPHAKLVTYPHCGHFPMLEARGPSTAELVSFLRAGATK
jgi:pimeloyl-ACP methyl ester carboxylesterase